MTNSGLRGCNTAVRTRVVEVARLVSGCLYVLERGLKRSEVEALSVEGPGVWFWSSIATACVRGRMVDYWVAADDLPAIERAREVAADCSGYDLREFGYSYGSIARRLTEWLDIRQGSGDVPLGMLPEWHYQRARPGYYRNMRLFDMRSAYWQLAARARSPLLHWQPEKARLDWLSVPNRAESRWRDMLQVVGAHKALRLAVIGVAATGWRDPLSRSAVRRALSGGRVVEVPLERGSLQPLACATVRVAYELSQMQGRRPYCVSPYVNADCVALPDGHRPEVWDSCGIEYAEKGAGDLDVRGVGVYSIGGVETKPFRNWNDLRILHGKVAPQVAPVLCERFLS